MPKSIRSTIGRKKRAAKRLKLMPREIARLERLAKIDQEVLARQIASKIDTVDTSKYGHIRKRKKLIKSMHTRSLRSGPKDYEINEIVKEEYVPQPRDYSKILLDDASDSDDDDVLSCSDDEYQEKSRAKDRRVGERKKEVTEEEGQFEKLLCKYRRKNKRLPKWATKMDRKMTHFHSIKSSKLQEDDIIFDWK